jgi:F-type H+-transporting ATPase subunit b
VLIDWFTVAAQIINFLVLVYLLKRFLYKPVVKAMDEREQRIAGRLKEAAKKEDEARHELERYEEKTREIDGHRQSLLNQMKEEVEAHRKALIDQTREQVEGIRANWHEALEREKDAFLQDLRERTGRHTYAIARQALKDLADIDVENQIIRVFIERLRSLDEEKKSAFRKSVGESRQGVRVISTFAISQDTSRQITHVLESYVPEPVKLQFETSPDVICGIELNVRGRKIAWSLRDYLEGLETDLAEVLTGQLKRKNEKGQLKRRDARGSGKAAEAEEGIALENE